MKKDILKKYLAYDSKVSVIVIDATNMVSDARNLHFMSNVVTAAFGRTMIATTMMSSVLKEENYKMTVQIKGDGPIGSIVVCGDNSLKIKGYALNPQSDLPLNEITGKLDVAKVVGKGYLNIIKDIGFKDPYVGYSELVSSEIAEDFAYYFTTSEQTPSVVSLGVNIDKNNNVQMAAGYIIQPLPDCDDSIIDIIESINMNIHSVTNLMIDLDNIDDVAKTITGDNDIKCIYEKEPKYECDCSSERIERTLIALGKEETEKILKENGNTVEVTCHFCNKVYNYSKEDIEKIFSKT